MALLVEQGAHTAELADPADPRDTGAWLTKQAVADQLGVGIRTVEGHAKEGRLRKARRRQPETGQHVTVYHPDDVAELAADRLPAPPPAFLVPTPPANGNGHGPASAITRPAAVDSDPLRTLATVLLAAWTEARQGAQGPQGSQGPQSENPFLTLAEAAAWRHVSEALVRRWMRTGKLDYEREPRSQWTATDRGWRIRQKHLEAV